MLCVDVCNWMAASGVGGWVCEFLCHNATNSLFIVLNVTWQ